MPSTPETERTISASPASSRRQGHDTSPVESQAVLRRRFGRFLAGFLRAGLFAVLSVVLWWLFAWTLQDQPWIQNELMLTVFSLFPAVLAATAFLLRVGQMQPFAAIGLSADDQALWHTGAGFVTGSGLALSVVGVQWAAGWVVVQRVVTEAERGDFAVSLPWAPSWWVGFLVLAVGAAGEELLFRGYGLQQLIRATNPWIAVIGSSVLFGVLHGGNPDASRLGMLNTVLFGVLFGFALVRHRSLWLPFGLHFGWNLTLGAVGANVSGLKIRLAHFVVVPDGPGFWSGAEYGPEASFVTSLATAVVLLILLKAPARRAGPRLWD